MPPARWATKYGPRRLRHEPPTLEDALFAAEGLADEPEQQLQIAAELMQLPIDDVRADILKLMKQRSTRTTITAGGRRGSLSGGSTVVVERKSAKRRIVTPAPRGGATVTFVRRG